MWRLWYQIPIALPFVGPRLLAARKSRFQRFTVSRAGGPFSLAEDDFRLYAERMRAPGHAVTGSRWYRTFLAREFVPWLRGEFANARVTVPVRWLHGTADPIITPTLLRGYADQSTDFEVELVEGVGHWIVEQRPELVLDRLRSFIARCASLADRAE